MYSYICNKRGKQTNMQRAVVHAVVLISRRSRSLVPHSWMSIVHILIFWSDRAHTAALWRSECTSIMLDFKASTNSCLLGYMAETFTIGVFILRRAVLSLSASHSTFSHGTSVRIPTPASPSAPCQPACRRLCVFRPEPRRNSYCGDRGDRCSLLYLCWVLKPPEF